MVSGTGTLFKWSEVEIVGLEIPGGVLCCISTELQLNAEGAFAWLGPTPRFTRLKVIY